MPSQTRRKGRRSALGSLRGLRYSLIQDKTADRKTRVHMHQPHMATRGSSSKVLQFTYLKRKASPPTGACHRGLLLPKGKMETLTLIFSTSSSLSVESREREQSHDRNSERNWATQKETVVWRKTMATPGVPSTHQQAHIP